MEMKAIQGREKRWTRQGRHVPSSMPGKREGEGQKDGGRAKKVDREKVGKAGTSGTVCNTMVSCPPPPPPPDCSDESLARLHG